MSPAPSVQFPSLNFNRWKPLSLYSTQGKCTMMDNATHLERFSHNRSWKPQMQVADAEHMCDQNFDYFLVLDLEDKVEIPEFPVVIATGMMSMMKQLQIPLLGSHHLGIDDTKNVARVLQRMLADGVLIQITARRNLASQIVDYLFKNRI
ncbi:hypothetical protein RJ641_000149 [Dillenia turbinata]|uniref:Uncharacterized protein n=1 Tax=Dillenia turbinata TaxID=194707 RepID=A0AAN8WEV6_9MAGN